MDGTPTTIRLDDLDVICAVLECTPADLLICEPDKVAARKPAIAEAGTQARLSFLGLGATDQHHRHERSHQALQVCGVRPPAMREIPYCFACWPGGPVTPPPCRRCGSTKDYFMSGLCARCHHHAPGPKTPLWESPGKLRRRPVVAVSSCPDCDAWGVTARYGWMCAACRFHREKYGPPQDCPTCGGHVPLGVGGSCRMCHKQRHLAAQQLGIRIGDLTLAEANAYGQQLFIAGTHRSAGTARREYQKKTMPADMSLLRPVGHQQLLCSTCRTICAWGCGTSSRRHPTRT